MGRGASKAGRSGGGEQILSPGDKERITKGIETHTKAENDGAETRYKENIEKEKNIIDNYDNYIRIGKIKSRNDEWWQSHESTYNALKSQLSFFRKERKRLRR